MTELLDMRPIPEVGCTWLRVHPSALHADAGICADCDDDLYHEDFIVHDEVWCEAMPGHLRGRLCVVCLEDRLGRRLQPSDFRMRADYMVWTLDEASDALFSRMTGQVPNSEEERNAIIDGYRPKPRRGPGYWFAIGVAVGAVIAGTRG